MASASASPAPTGRALTAAWMPEITLERSNGSRSPDRLSTVNPADSARSNVVNRVPHARHSRRRRMATPSSDWRESTTFESRWPHEAQRTQAS